MQNRRDIELLLIAVLSISASRVALELDYGWLTVVFALAGSIACFEFIYRGEA
jgi:hypothetical protein